MHVNLLRFSLICLRSALVTMQRTLFEHQLNASYWNCLLLDH